MRYNTALVFATGNIMQRHSPLFLTTILIGNLAFAQTQPDNELLIPSDSPKPGDKDFVPPPALHKEKNVIDEAMLRSNPQLLTQLLDQAVMTEVKDRELSIWKRYWHLWGITPKLNIDWSKSTSNHFYYDGQSSKNAYIEFSKTF